jgi:hypothetical protein
VSGSATITDPSSAFTTVTGVAAGTSVTLRWTMSNGTCPDNFDEVTIQHDELPTVADAGPDQANCGDPNFIMTANTPTVGTGTWTLISGVAAIVNPSSPTSDINGVAPGTSAVLRWTISNGVCPDAWDEVTVQNDVAPTTSAAGPDQVLCNTSSFNMAANTPEDGVGAWSIISGTATITIPSSPTTTVTGVAPGTNVVLRWTINTACGSSSDDVLIQNDELPTVANAGPDITQCDNTDFTMAGNAATVGTGLWTLISGTATITTPSSPTTTVTGLVAGTSATLRWTVSNGVCADTWDEITIQNDEQVTTANAGTDQDICNNADFTMAANTPVVGTGTWTLISGTATINSVNSPSTTITGVPSMTSATLRWTIDNGVCTSFDEITLVNSNCKPVALDDVEVVYNSNTVAIDVLFNDSDAEGQPLSITIITGPDNGGSAVVNNNGTPLDATDDWVDYTPSGSYTGPEVFEYQICDNGIPVECDTATVTINIVANTGLVGTDDAYSTTADCPTMDLPVLNNDYDPDFGQQIASLTITSTPDLGGSANVHDNGTPGDGSDDYVEYVQTGLTTGLETFQYQICDNGIPQICRTATVTVDITPNVGPTAMDDTIYVLDITPRVFNPLHNDVDQCGDLNPATVTVIVPPTLATITNVDPATGAVTITAAPGVVGEDQFTYIVADYGIPTGRGPLYDTAIVYFEVISYAPESEDNVFFEDALIIDMGVLPQTAENALRPYGLVYDLVRNYDIPVEWSIKGSKRLGELDFIHNGKEYYGGPFIIRAEYRSPVIDAVVNSWAELGVQVDTAVHDVHIPVMETINGLGNLCVEKNASNEIKPYMDHAMIPYHEYVNEVFIHLGELDSLKDCCDTYLMPHYLNPTWDTRRFRDLQTFVKSGGNFWAMCQSVSQMENMHAPGDTSNRLNMLSTNGLQCYGNNGCNDTYNDQTHALQPLPSGYAYDSSTASGMLMQWVGEFWEASDNGNERWFIPGDNSAWGKTTVNVLQVADTNAAGVHGTKYVYGFAYDNPDYGMVQYQAGHNYNPNASGNPSDHVTALRAFFNFVFQVSDLKGKHDFRMRATGPECFDMNGPNLVKGEITQGWRAGPFDWHWTSTIPGTFSNPNARVTNFTPAPGVTEEGWLTVTASDGCNGTRFDRIPVNIFRIGVPPGSVSCYGNGDGSLDLEVLAACEPVSYLWSTGDTTQDVDSLYAGLYTVAVTDGAGNVLVDYAWVDPAWRDYCVGGPLPVELGEFYGETINDQNHLFWTTLSELNNSHFNIMRSVDGILFEKIGETGGHGTTSDPHEYHFVDTNPYEGLNYYRLEQVDFDGTTDQSNIISLLITREGRASTIVWPNPSSGLVNMSVVGNVQGETFNVRIYDMKGTVVEDYVMNYDVFNRTTFDLSSVPAGVYFMEVWNDFHRFSNKIVIR